MIKFFLVVFIFISGKSFSQSTVYEYNYANGNGTILSRIIENDDRIVIRKHEQRFRIYPYGEIIAYENPDKNSRELFRLKDGDYINTLQIAFIENLSAGMTSNWVFIKDDNDRTGWLDMDCSSDPYRDGNWSILEIIENDKGNWTVRKMDGGLSITKWIFRNSGVRLHESVNVYNEPGGIETGVLFQLTSVQNEPEMGVTILAITEQEVTLVLEDGEWIQTDHWIKIIDDQGRIGWMFGAYGGRNGGGPRLAIPSSIISFYFNLP